MVEIHPTATVADSAVVRGDVTIGADSRILPGVVLHGRSERSASARTSSSWSIRCCADVATIRWRSATPCS
jgi:carbonic anhydrase/acetyltransferase-like protein (isoleucine patch superfamily)